MVKLGGVLGRVAALLLAAGLVACGDDDPAGPGPGDSDFEWTGDVDQGLAVEIKGISGGITASLAPGSEVEVYAALDGIRDDPSTVSIQVVRHAG